MRIFPWSERDEEITVGYRIQDGTIRVKPWPFSVGSHMGYLVGYQLESYPTVLEPVIVPYRLVGLTESEQQSVSDFFRTSPLAEQDPDLTRDQSGLRRDAEL